MDSYVALHCHSTYSFMDAVGSIDEWVKGAKAKGLAGLAITDHGDASSMLELYNLGKQHGLPVIMGCEFYIVMDSDKNKEDKYSHIVVWAKNQEGYRNICRLTYLSYTDANFYYKPRITFDNLLSHKEGLVIGSGCVQGVVAKYIQRPEDVDGTLVNANMSSLKDAFGDDFYLEMQYGDLTWDWDEKEEKFVRSSSLNRQAVVNKVMWELSKKYGVKVIATPDAHMVDKDQKVVQDIQLKNFYKNKRCYYETFYLPTRAEFVELFEKKHPYLTKEQVNEALDNTHDVLNKCKDLKLSFGYNLPEVKMSGTIIDMVKEKGIIDLSNPVYVERLNKELEVISNNGVIDLLPYFLILEDLVKWCECNGIMVGPGRGSAAGCLLNYALGITKVDPIKYNLPFSRFLNGARVKKGTLPDIDLDFSHQQQAKDYLVRKYGQKHVFNISVNQTLKARLAFKDVVRVMKPQMTAEQANEYSKMILFSTEEAQRKVLQKSVACNYKLKSFFETEKDIYDAVSKLIGQVRQRGTHAAAVVMSKDEVFNIVPVAKNRVGGDYVTQYTMKWCEAAGLIKYDILGLRTLKDIFDTIKLIKYRHKKDINVFKLDFDDKEIFRQFEKCNTDTVFQFNTDLIKRILRKVKVNSLEDLSIITSVGRPGPMDVGMHETFIARVRGNEAVEYPHPALKSVLKDTYGIMVYQEQVMEAVRVLGGFTEEEADDVRRAMGKKKIELLDKAKSKFIDFAIKNYNDITDYQAEKLWDLIYSFGGYGFCHAHALAYSMVAYICMYLKHYYSLEWWASVLNNETETDLIKTYYLSNKKMFVLPDINKSKMKYVIHNNKIIMPLSFLSRIGDKAVAEIVDKTDKQEFTSLRDFLDRTDRRVINKTVMLNLIWADAFQSISDGKTAKQLAVDYYYYAVVGKGRAEMAKMLEECSKEIESLNRFDLIRKKMESCPLFEMDYQLYFKEYFHEKTVPIDMILACDKEARLYTGGVITGLKVIKTKHGDQMAFAELTNNNKSVELVIFPREYATLKDKIKNNTLSEVKGRISLKDNKRSVVVEEIKIIDV